MSTFEARTRALAGATRFDETHPGWADLIDVSKLDVSSDWACPVAQITEVRYSQSPYAKQADATEHGLYSRARIEGLPDEVVRIEYAELTAAWIPLVQERKQERPGERPGFFARLLLQVA